MELPTKEERLTERIARFESSERHVDDYLDVLLAGLAILREGSGVDWLDVFDAVPEGLRQSGRVIVPPARNSEKSDDTSRPGL